MSSRIKKMLQGAREISRDGLSIIRFIERNSDADSRVGRRIRKITDNTTFRRVEKGIKIADGVVSGVEAIIHGTAPSNDLPIGHTRVPRTRERAPPPRYSRIVSDSDMADEIVGNVSQRRGSALRRR